MQALSSIDSDIFGCINLAFYFAMAVKVFGYHGSIVWNIDPIQLPTFVIDTCCMRQYFYK